MNVVIFSKDRAMQLDLLLRSMPDEPKQDAEVIMKCSNTSFYNGYLKLIEQHDVTFTFQSDFKQDVLDAINGSDDMTVFFTDDDVFINSMPELDYQLQENMACISLRLNPNLPYCYTLNREQSVPQMFQFRVKLPGYPWDNRWDWTKADADYGYPMSLDGHVFRTADILPLLKELKYSNPNELEGQIARHPIDRPYMMCFDKSIIVNNPINRVQDVCPNRHGGITAEYLNEQWLSGKRIRLEPFLGYKNRACHEEMPIEFE